jgi:branched-chain amino acid transport system ATP-binding protein
MNTDRVLDIVNVSVGYGGLPVVRGVSLHVNGGEIVALLGANGAGKTTTLLAISGLLEASEGRIEFNGAEVTPRRRHALADLGMAHVPEDRGIFHGLTVRENLLVDRRVGRNGVDMAVAMFPALAPLLDRQAGLLSGGEQQMLALGRALASRPKLLMLDEMSHGLAPIVIEAILPQLTEAVDAIGCSVIIVEQHVHLALEVAQTAYVLSRGVVVLSGAAADVADRALELEAAYLSADREHSHEHASPAELSSSSNSTPTI